MKAPVQIAFITKLQPLPYRKFHRSQRLRNIMAILAMTSFALSTAGLAAKAKAPPINVDGVAMRVIMEGVGASSGAPAVVFEAGLGDGKASFAKQIKALSVDTTVFAYDRPGYGSKGVFAADGDGKRTGEEVAKHLRATLHASGVAPPYILVGHSIGGLYALNFVALYPDEVAGIVLVDSRPAGFTARCKASESGLCDVPGFISGLFPKHQKAEFRGILETERTAATALSLGAIPVTVISSDAKPDLTAGQFQTIWESMQRDFAATAQRGRFVLAKGASHYVHQVQPNLVTDEIRLIFAQSR